MNNREEKEFIANFLYGIGALVVTFAILMLIQAVMDDPKRITNIFNASPSPLPKNKMQKSITVINTGNTYRCRAPGAKLRNYFDQLVAQGWTVTSSETNNFYGDYGNSRGPCSITYYVLEK
jgi:hypothetical protein